MYELAKSILDERRRIADKQRLIAELRRIGSYEATSLTDEAEDSWILEWTANGFTGKRVRVANRLTGERPTGRDPSDWDRALGNALGLTA